MELDQHLVTELRLLADAGSVPAALLAVIGERIGGAGTNYRLLAIAYFQRAFLLPLCDATRIGASSVFPGGERTSAELNAAIGPLLDATRSQWSGK